MKTKFGFLLCLISVQAFSWTHVGTNIYGWKTRNLTFSVNPSGCTVSDTELYSVIDEAIQIWNGVPDTDLTLSRSSTVSATTVNEFITDVATDAPVILCDPNFSSAVEDDPNVVIGMAMRTAFNSEGHINYSGIILNSKAGAGAEISQFTHDELVLILAHEMGHALGLGHSGVPKALMYYSLAGKTKALLIEDDMDGIAHLYPRNEFSNGPFGCAAVHRKETHANYDWACFGLLLILLNVYVGRRFTYSRS